MQAHAAFRDETERMLHYRRAHFCTMEGSDNAPLFSQCCTPRKPGACVHAHRLTAAAHASRLFICGDDGRARSRPGDKFFPCVEGFDPPAPLPECTHPNQS